MLEVSIKCESCGRLMKATEHMVGRRGKCVKCKAEFVIDAEFFRKSTSETTIERQALETVVTHQSDERASTPSSDKSLSTPNPARIGKFELVELLGEGAFGKVYKAIDGSLGRIVALKIPSFSTDNQKKVERFIKEAKAAASLKHPNIVTVYEAGQIDGKPYIASEFINGETLGSRIRNGEITFEQVVRWIGEIAEALSFAHSQGIIHRDIKSENIMIDTSSKSYLMDFGLAKQLYDDSSQTIDGTVMGTPAYMAPEQARGDHKQIGPLSDQYSLGAVLYEALTGTKPFSGSVHEVLGKVLYSDPTPIESLRPTVPAQIIAICRKAMSKDPSNRYSSLDSFYRDLQICLEEKEFEFRLTGPTKRRRRRSKLSQIMTAFTLLAICSVALGVYQLQSSNRPHSRSEGTTKFESQPKKAGNRSKVELTASHQREIVAKLLQHGCKVILEGTSVPLQGLDQIQNTPIRVSALDVIDLPPLSETQFQAIGSLGISTLTIFDSKGTESEVISQLIDKVGDRLHTIALARQIDHGVAAAIANRSGLQHLSFRTMNIPGNSIWNSMDCRSMKSFELNAARGFPLPAISQMEGLTDAVLWSCGLSNGDLKHLSNLKKIKTLQLGANQITGGLEQLSASSLIELSLHGCPVSDQAILPLLKLKSLQVLALSSTDVSDQTAKNLHQLPKLRRVEIGTRNITDQAALELNRIQTLEHLDVGDATGLTDQFLVNLNAADKLRILKLPANLSSQVITEFKKRNPRCTVSQKSSKQ